MIIIENIMSFVSNITSFLKTSVIAINPVFTPQTCYQIYKDEQISSNVYIKSLSLSNFNIYLSMDCEQSDFLEKLMSGFLATIMTTFVTIKNTKFKLEGGIFTNIYGDFSDIFSLISNQYKKSLGNHFWKIAGSSFSNFFKNIFGANDDNKNKLKSDFSIIQKYKTNIIKTNEFRINIPLLEIAKEGFGSGLCLDLSKLLSVKLEMDSISKHKQIDIANRKARTFYGKYKFVSILFKILD